MVSACSWFGLFQNDIVQNGRQLWRPVLSYSLRSAGRSLAWIYSQLTVIPVFVVVLSITSALGLILWRAVYYLLNRQTG